MGLFDAHAHLAAPDFAGDLPEVVARAEAAGVRGIVAVGETLEDAERRLVLADRLARNPHLAGGEAIVAERGSVTAALNRLHGRARACVTETASGVFVTTAVSQSGRLDALVVLAAQTRMIWYVAEIYWQRPGRSRRCRLARPGGGSRDRHLLDTPCLRC